MSEDSRGALKYFFGFDDFLDNQQEIVDRILEGRDLGVVMPTGAGKSLCYQLPALMRSGYSIVVSPLISLMKDQVDSLRNRGIAAACINSSVDFSEQQSIMRDVENGMVKLLYVAPERFGAASFRNLLGVCPPETLIVDEAHCISQWGHDFRPAYLRIGDFVESLQIGQVCAFTATATKQVRDDIRTQLHRPDMEMMVAGFKRPNLAFSVLSCPRQENKERAIASLLEKPCPTIIYASTRKAVEEVSQRFNCIAYHAGMSDEARTEAQDRFMSEPCPVLVATNAFGMGIDRPDVRRVIHYNMPGSLEAYYQEAGRAGRDGEPADCILLFSYSDRFVQEFLIDMSNPPPEAVHGTWRALRTVAAQRNSTALEISSSELAGMVVEAKNEQTISNAMSILEKNGYIERSFRGQNAGSIRFIGDLQALAETHAAEATQRSRFISRALRYYGAAASQEQSCTYEQLAAIAGLNVEQLKRVLRALDGDCIAWDAPFSGRATVLLRPDDITLDIDFSEMERKHSFELSRLDEVIGYTKVHNCRQSYLIEYFGETGEAWTCGCCDLCAGEGAEGSERRKPDVAELDAIRTVLCAVDFFGGRLGSGKISMVLAGARRAEIAERRLDRNAFFGKLSQIKQSKLMELMRSLENARLLCRCGSQEYPCINLTATGAEVAAGADVPILEIPDLGLRRRARVRTPEELAAREERRAERREERQERRAERREERREERQVRKAEVAGFFGDDAALFTRLRELRMEMAREQHVPPYVIFPDSTLKELVTYRPKNLDEAALLKGVGPAKLASVMPRFLELLNTPANR